MNGGDNPVKDPIADPANLVAAPVVQDSTNGNGGKKKRKADLIPIITSDIIENDQTKMSARLVVFPSGALLATY